MFKTNLIDPVTLHCFISIIGSAFAVAAGILLGLNVYFRRKEKLKAKLKENLILLNKSVDYI